MQTCVSMPDQAHHKDRPDLECVARRANVRCRSIAAILAFGLLGSYDLGADVTENGFKTHGWKTATAAFLNEET
jgi:hypothetical protein